MPTVRDSITDVESFDTACRAFALFTITERLCALERFKLLRMQSVSERFIDAVHDVIVMPPDESSQA